MAGRKWVVRILVSIVLFLGAALISQGSAQAKPQQFTPLPAPNVEWQLPNPNFTALSGARALFGTFSGGGYQIEVPSNWNGELVVWAHGFFGGGAQLIIQMPPIREYLIQNGYAWAAASYRANGYIPGIGAQDSLNLKALFTTLVGKPTRTYLYGQSMGGHVAMISAEFYPDAYDGILTECGVVGGYELFDFFLASAAAAEFLTGSSFATGGAAELPRILAALGAGDSPSTAGKEVADAMINLSGGPRPFAVEGLVSTSLGGSQRDTDVSSGATGLFNPTASPVAMVATNSGFTYSLPAGFPVTSAQLNAGVRRKTADPSFRNVYGPYAELAPFTGEIRAPVLQIKGTGDLFVPISMEQTYLAKAKAAGTTNLLVQRAIRSAGHCNFTTSERIRAFSDLSSWVRYGFKPAGDDLSGDLSDIGKKFTDPARGGDPGTRIMAP